CACRSTSPPAVHDACRKPNASSCPPGWRRHDRLRPRHDRHNFREVVASGIPGDHNFPEVVAIMSTWIDPVSIADAGAYLARLVRLDPAALVRLRPAGDGAVAAVALWARLPFEVMVTRWVRASLAEDVTVRASDLLRALDGELPSRRDSQWCWPVPRGLE